MDVQDKIKLYLNDHGIEIKWFAEKIGINPKLFYQILSKKKSVPKKYWEAIIVLTNGEISLYDLAEISLEKLQESQRKKYKKIK